MIIYETAKIVIEIQSGQATYLKHFLIEFRCVRMSQCEKKEQSRNMLLKSFFLSIMKILNFLRIITIQFLEYRKILNFIIISKITMKI